jgi:aspartyl-tRNA synthetase
MSFVNADDVMNVVEEMLKDVVKTLYPDRKIVKDPFPKLTWDYVMNTW